MTGGGHPEIKVKHQEHAGYTEDGQSDIYKGPEVSALESDLQGFIVASSGCRCGADVGSDGYPHSGVTGKGGAEGSEKKSDS